MKKGVGLNDAYNVDLLEAELSRLGYVFSYLPETESTMQIIEQEAAQSNGEKILVLTDHQTKGVGRKNRVWMDTPRVSLMFSILFHVPQESIAAFADMVALCVSQVLQAETGLPIKIKYPNDLVIEEKKTGGILVKNIYDDKIAHLGTNVGIGINVHYTDQEIASFPSDYGASALDIAAKMMLSRGGLLIAIAKALRFIDTETRVIEKNPLAREEFNKKWREASSVLGREIAILKGDSIIDRGRVIDTEIGRGIEIETNEKKKWISLFETDMKARIVN